MNKLKNTKKGILILSILLLFLVIGAASAADDKISEDDLSAPTDSVDEVVSANNDDEVSTAGNTLGSEDTCNLTSVNNDVLKSDDNDDVLSDSDYNDLSELGTLVSVTPNKLDVGSDFIYSGTPLTISKSNYIIDFHGHIINGNLTEDGGVLNIASNNLTIKNLKIINTKTSVGADMYNGFCKIYGRDITFDNLTTENVINVIASQDDSYNLVIKNSNIAHVGTYTLSVGNCEIFNTNFTSTNRDYVGLTMAYTTNIKVYNCNFYQSRLRDLSKGGIEEVYNCTFYNTDNPMAVNSPSHVYNCTYIDCSALTGNEGSIMGGTSGIAGALFENLKFIRCNSGIQYIIRAHSAVVTITGCVFINCSSTAGEFISNVDKITNSYVEGCTMRSMGPSMYENCTFVRNDYGGYQIIDPSANCIVRDCKFINNTGSRGIIYTTSANVLIRVYNTTFERAGSEFDGWAISAWNNPDALIYLDDLTTFNNITNKAVIPEVYDSTINNILYVNQTGGGDGSIDNPTTITDALNRIDPEGTIVFINNGQPYNFDNQLIMKYAITIDGNGVTINNNNQGRYVFYTSDIYEGITLKNFNFEKCGSAGYDAGALYLQAGTRFSILNCNFTECTGDTVGAIFYSQDTHSINTKFLTVDNCIFTKNTALGYYSSSDDINNYGYESAGAIFSQATGVSITNCKFIENSGLYVGAVLLPTWTGTSIVENCSFTKNTATTANPSKCQNMGIGLDTYLPIDYINAGALALIKGSDGSRIVGCNFTGNSAPIAGAVSSWASEIVDCNFIENTVIGDIGGVLYLVHNNNNVIDCNFTGNTAPEGSIYLRWNHATVSGCNFTDNIGGLVSGICLHSDKVVDVVDCDFTGNTVSNVDGGVIYATQGTVNVLDSNFTGNVKCIVISRADAGILSVSGSRFVDNTGVNGSAVYSFSRSVITDSIFTGNTVTGNGGAIYINSTDSTITNSNFTNNNAGQSAGAIYNLGLDLSISDSRFIGNTANSSTLGGGAILTYGDTMLITDSVFTKNYAINHGGAIYITPDLFYFVDRNTESTFTLNKCGNTEGMPSTKNWNNIYDQGANLLLELVYVVYNPSAWIHDGIASSSNGETWENATTFKNALSLIAPTGTMIFVNGTGEIYKQQDLTSDFPSSLITLNKKSITLQGNNTTFVNFQFIINNEGIKLYNIIFANNTYNSNIPITWIGIDGKIENCTFTNNGGTTEGQYLIHGAMDVEGENLLINNCTFTNNHAFNPSTQYGGAIYINSTGTTISDCTFDSNVCNYGSHIALSSNSYDIIITGSRFNGGYGTDQAGHAIYIESSENVQILDCNFTNNRILYYETYGNDGAAIHVGGTAYVIITGNRFKNNTATNGGAISFTEGSTLVTLNNNNFIENNAYTNGGALIITNTGFNSFSGNTFTGNKVTNGNGGAIYTVNPLNIESATFDNNQAEKGGAIYTLSSLNISSSSFGESSANTANNGGAIYAQDALRIVASSFYNNKATTGNGGAIYTNVALSIVGSNFTKNVASANGGAVYSVANIDIIGCEFNNNTAGIDGGALYLKGNNNKIVDTVFRQNSAVNGGAVYIESGKSLNLTSVFAYDNDHTTEDNSHLGTFYVVDASLVNDNLVLGENQDVWDGSYHADIIYVSGSGSEDNFGGSSTSSTTLNNALNEIYPNGKIIFVGDYNDLSETISKNVTLIGNGYTLKRSNGKSIFVLEDGSAVTLCNLTLDGGIEVGSGATLNVENATIKNADVGIASSGNVIVNNVTFTGNVRAIDATGGSLTVINSTFTGNTGEEYRNIHVGDDVTKSVSGTTFDTKVSITAPDYTYLKDIIISGVYDAGVNFNISGITLAINTTNGLVNTINVNSSGEFRSTFTQVLDAGKYNVTLSSVDSSNNIYQLNESSKVFNINKKHITIYPANSNWDIVESVRYNSTNNIIQVRTRDDIDKRDPLVVKPASYGLDLINCIITFNGTNKTVEKIDGRSFYLRNIDAGTYKLNITLNHPNLEGSYYRDFTIDKGIASLNIPDLVIAYGEGGQVIINSYGSSVKFWTNQFDTSSNEEYGSFISIDGKNITVNSELPEGKYDFTFIIVDKNWQSYYNGDDGDYYTVAHFKVTVTKAPVNVTVDVKDIIYNDTVVVDYVLDNINNTAIVPDGLVTITVYNQKGEIIYTNPTSSFKDEKGSLSIEDYKFNVGTYTVNVKYTGSGNFLGNNTNYTFTVGKAESSFNPIDDIIVTYGNYTVTVSGNLNASDYNGTVTITIDGTAYNVAADASGSFTADLTFGGDIHVGTHKIVVRGTDCLNYNAPQSTSFNLTVQKAEAKFDAIDNITVTYGDGGVVISGTISDIINGDAYNGTVTVMIDGKYMNVTDASNRGFSLNVPFDGELNTGDHTITVSGSECLNYKALSDLIVNLTVKKATVSITSVEDMTVTYGMNNAVNVTGRINSTRKGVNYTGEITVNINGKSGKANATGDGSFTVTVNDIGKLSVGEYAIEVEGAQTQNYNSISKFSDAKLNVEIAGVDIVEVSDLAVDYGMNDTIVVAGKVNHTVYGSAFAGKVNVTIGKYSVNDVAVDENGAFVARISVDKDLVVSGSPYAIVVSASGDSNYSVKSASKELTVNAASVDIVDVGDLAVDYGMNDTIVVAGKVNHTVYGSAFAGKVNVTIGKYSANDVAVDENGAFVARISVDKDLVVSGSPYDIVVSASGDSNYDVDTNNAKKLTVNRVTVGIKSVEGIRVTYGVNNTVIVTGKVDATGNGVNYTGEIKITINGKSNTANAVNGEFNVTIDGIGNFSVDEYKIEVEGAQTQNYNEIVKDDTKAILNVTKAYIDITHVDKISVVYGANNTLIITGAIVNMNNTHGWAENYTGNITVIVKNHSDIGATNSVNRDGTFTVTINNDSIANLTKGSYAIIVSTSGDANYTAFAAKEFNALEVEKAVVNVTSVSVDSIVYGVNNTLVVNGKINNSNNTKGLADNYTGEVTVSIVGHPEIKGYSTVAIDGSFTITINNVDIGALNVGKYNFTVSTGGSDNYEGFSCEFEDVLEVVKADINVTGVSVDSVVYGANNTLVVVGSVVNLNNTHGWAENYVGRITVSVKGQGISNYTTVNNDGFFTVTIVDDKISALTVGKYTLSIESDVDDNYNVYSNEFKDALDVTLARIDVVSVEDISVVYGANNTLIVVGKIRNVDNAKGLAVNYTGEVTVSVKGYEISNTGNVEEDGSFTVTIVNDLIGGLAVGKYNLTVSTAGDGNYAAFAGKDFEVLEVEKALINVTGVSVDSVVYGANNTLVVVGSVVNLNNTHGWAENYVGRITVSVKGHEISNYTTVNNDGSFTVTIVDDKIGILNVDNYTLSIMTADDSNYEQYVGEFENALKVTQADVKVTNVNDIIIVYGMNNTITVTGNLDHTNYGANYTGTVAVIVENGEYVISNTISEVSGDGTFKVVIKDNNAGLLNVAKYKLNITLGGTDNYKSFNDAYDKLEVVPASVNVTEVESIKVTYGADNSVCVIGKLNATGYGINYTGEIAVYVNNVKVGSNNAKTDGSFNISVNVAGLPVGEYHITLCGEATDNYNAISNVTKGIINVTKKTIDVSNISIKSLAYGAQNNVTITGEVSTVEYGSNYTGKITVNINGATGEANALNGEFEVNVIGIGNFDAKSYDITVAGENSDDYEFNGKTETDGLTITNATVEIIKINNKDVVYGASNFTVISGELSTVNYGANYTGLIAVTVGSANGSGYARDGKFEVTVYGIGAFDAGKYDIIVSGVADVNYNAVEAMTLADGLDVVPANVVVNYIAPVSVVYGAQDNVIVAGTLNTTNYVANYTGLIAVTVGSANGSGYARDGKFEVTVYGIGALDVGKYNVTVSGGADSPNYNIVGEIQDECFTIVPASVKIIGIDYKEVIYCENNSVEITGYLSTVAYGANYTGLITVNIGGASGSARAVNGTFTVTVNGVGAFDVGEYSVVAYGDADSPNYYNIESYTEGNALNVTPRTIEIIQIDPKEIVYGAQDNVTITGTIETVAYGANYTGLITVNIGGASGSARAVNGTFTVTVNNIGKFDVGKYNISASGASEGNYKVTGDNLVGGLDIVRANISILEVESYNIVYGENNTITVTCKLDAVEYGIDYAGKITVVVNNQSFEGEAGNGAFAVQITGVDMWDVGNYTLTVSGEQTSNYNAINDYDDAYVNIVKETPVMDASITQVVKVDQNASVTVSLPVTATGVVYIEFNGTNYTINLDSQENTAILPIVPVGTYDVIVYYGGDKNYNAAKSVEMTFAVKKYDATDLQKLIDEAIANNESEVNLTHDYEFGEDDTPVKVNGSIKINGNNHTIDANGTSGIFNITSDNVELDNMTLTGSNDTAVSSTGNNTKISDINLTNNNGTGINIQGDNATISNVDITGNNGTAVNVTGDNSNIKDINITGNNGPGINVEGNNATLDDVAVSGGNGTAVNVKGNGTELSGVNVTGNNGPGVNVEGNNATLDDVAVSGGNGTAVNVTGDNSNVKDVNVTDNVGPGVNVEGNNATISDIDISGNKGTGLNVNSTGANLGNITIKNSNGTGLEIAGDNVTTSDIELKDNNGTGIKVDGNGAKMDNITVSGNNGTAMEINGNDATLENSTFTNNTGTNGAGVVINGNGAFLNNATFTNNTAETGAGVVINGNGASVENSTFIGNNATSGAGIISNGNGTDIKGSTFENNNAYAGAGVILNGNDANVENSTFVGNNATVGAGIVSTGNGTNISESTFTNNTATTGAGVVSSGNGVTINDSEFANNTATTGAGAVLNGDNATVEGSTFAGNEAVNGAGIVSTGDNTNVTGSTFENNTAVTGAGIISNGTGTNIVDSEFTGNKAEAGAGAVLNGDNATVSNATFAGNNATSGAGIVVNGGGASVNNTNFTGNTAADGSSAIAVGGKGTVDVDNKTKENSDVPVETKITELVVDQVTVDGNDVAIRVNVTASAGTVYVEINGKKYSANVDAGLATIKISGLPVGEYDNLTVVYDGAEGSSKTFANVSFKVTKVSTKLVGGSIVTVYYLQGAKTTVRVLDVNGKVISGATVTFKVNSKSYTAVSDANGYAGVKLNLAPGTYTVTASYDGNSVSNKVVVKHIVSAKKTSKVKKSARKTIIKITVKGHKVKQSSKVKFTYKGKNKVKVKFGKVMKKQTVTVKFKGKSYKVKVNKKGVGTIKLSKKTAKKLKRGKKYSAKVTYSGPKLYKKIKVTVKFNGKKYKVKTNKQGVAKFKLTKKMVKKFKKGKKVKYTVIYKSDKLTRYVKIVK